MAKTISAQAAKMQHKTARKKLHIWLNFRTEYLTEEQLKTRNVPARRKTCGD